MSERLECTTREDVLEKILAQRKGEKIRVVQLEVFGKELTHAAIIRRPDKSIFRNLCLDIGFHEGATPYFESIGVMTISPPEAVIIMADIAVKSGNVNIGFMDRFSGCLIITGKVEDVRTAFRKILRYFRDELRFTVCQWTEE